MFFLKKGLQMIVQGKDPSTAHFHVSLIKSVIRMCAGFALGYSQFALAGALVIFAEVLGVVEELV